MRKLKKYTFNMNAKIGNSELTLNQVYEEMNIPKRDYAWYGFSKDESLVSMMMDTSHSYNVLPIIYSTYLMSIRDRFLKNRTIYNEYIEKNYLLITKQILQKKLILPIIVEL